MRQETINNLVKASNALSNGSIIVQGFENTKKSLDTDISKLFKK